MSKTEKKIKDRKAPFPALLQVLINSHRRIGTSQKGGEGKDAAAPPPRYATVRENVTHLEPFKGTVHEKLKCSQLEPIKVGGCRWTEVGEEEVDPLLSGTV